MKTLALAVIATMAASSAYAFDFDGSNKSSWKIGGKIEKRCAVQVKSGGASGNMSTSLDLSDMTAQRSAHVYVWCNVDNDKANVTYKSKNGGKLVSGDKEIDYKLRVGFRDGDAEYDLATHSAPIDHAAAHGTEVDRGALNQIFIKPMVTGREYAGVYRDRIYVKVKPN